MPRRFDTRDDTTQGTRQGSEDVRVDADLC
jgi:hypothetical protein